MFAPVLCSGDTPLDEFVVAVVTKRVNDPGPQMKDAA
jgi:hypothetical protein